MEKYTIPANTLKVGTVIKFELTQAMEKQQSAVEWLIEQLTYDNGNGVRMPSWQDGTDLTHFCDKAKELFKQQIEEACIEFMNTDGIENKKELAQQYFNETFKQ